MRDLKTWLDRMNLGEYADVLTENDVDLDVAPSLTETDLKDLGLSLGHRKKFIAAARNLAAEPGSGTPQPADSGSAKAGDGERRQLTVMFCDLVGSTELAQSMDPEQLREPMRRYQDAVAGAVVRYGGYVAKFLGDGVLAYFGWPQAQEDEADRSVRAALEALTAVAEVSLEDGARLRARVGIATGTVVVGDLVGAVATEPGAVLGDTPNLAARLQSLASPGAIVVNRLTHSLCGQGYEFKALGAATLKGFAQPVDAWQVVAPRHAASRFDATRGGELTAFVGRAQEIQVLLDRWARVKSGEGQALLLGGEAGIGKSRILQELQDRLRQEPGRVLLYQCSPYQVNAAFSPVIQQLYGALQSEAIRTQDEKLDALEQYLRRPAGLEPDDLALIADLLSLPAQRYPAPDMTPQRKKLRTIDVLIEHILALGVSAPVALLVEDAHWIDSSTLELLEALLTRTEGRQILMVITHRPEFEPPWPGFDHLTRLSLNRLSRDQGAAMVQRIARDRRLPDAVRDRILAHTDGIPLFVEELTKTVVEAGLDGAGDGGADAGDGPAQFAIPSTLRGSLMTRLDRLGEAKRILQTAACIGREFPADLLAELLGVGEEALDASLVEALASGLISRRRTAHQTVYIFKHALVQDAASDSLLASHRRSIHAGLAALLSGRDEYGPLLIAQHYAAAGRGEDAALNYLASGRQSLETSALSEAIGALELGLEQIPALAPSSSRDRLELDLRLALGTARMAQFGWPHVSVPQALEPAFELAQRLDDSRALGPIFWGLWVHYQTCTEFAVALEWLARLDTVLGQRDDTELAAVRDMSAGCQYFWSAEYDKARAYTDHIRAHYDAERHAGIVRYANHDPLCFSLHWAGAFLEWITGYPDRALNSLDQAVTLARRVGHPFNTAFALTGGSHALLLLGDPARLLRQCDEVEALARREGLGPFTLNVQVAQWRGMALIASGRFAEGYQSIKAGNDFWIQAGGRVCSALFWSAIARGLGGLGRYPAALELIDRALTHCRVTGDRYMEPEVLRIRAALLHGQGGAAPGVIETTLLEAIQVARAHQARSWELRSATDLARLLQSQHRAGEARQHLAPIYAWFKEGLGTPDLVEAGRLLEQPG